jgi:hypothetical protein
VKGDPALALESPKLDKPYSFQILSLDTADNGTFKEKSYKRSHLSEMNDLYTDVSRIRKPDNHMIMVGNGMLIKHTGDINS